MRYISFLFALCIVAGCADNSAPSNAERVELPLQCDEKQITCSGLYKNTQYKLTLSEPNLPALEPLSFVLQATDLESEKAESVSIKGIEAWFEGRDMFMGEHKLSVEYSSEGVMLNGIIPVCVTGSDMVWRLNILLQRGQEPLRAYADLRSLTVHE